MPAKTDRRHRQGAESRRRILEAAIELASERGYDGTTMALITERTGLPASSVYWQFRNKDELLAEALDYSYRDWRRHGPTWQPGNYIGTPAERIRKRLYYSHQSIQKQPEYWRLGLMVALLRKSDKIAAQDRFLRVRGETIAVIEEWWRSVISPQAAAQRDIAHALTTGYLALVDGMFVAHRAEPDLELAYLADIAGDAIGKVAERWSADPEGTLARLQMPEPPRPKGSRRRTADESRVRLLNATADIAAERGYRGTTISRICQRAQLPVSSVYWFFSDKDELLAEVVQHSWDEWFGEQPSWELPKDDETRRDALYKILTQAVRSLNHAPSFMRIGHMLTLEQHSTEIAARTQFLQIRTGIEHTITEWFRDTVDPEILRAHPRLPYALAHLLVAFTDGFFLSTQIDNQDHPTVAFVEFIVDVLETAATDPATTPTQGV